MCRIMELHICYMIVVLLVNLLFNLLKLVGYLFVSIRINAATWIPPVVKHPLNLC
ncbi:hypothetical protein VHE8714_03045 [Vibrio splendidus]|nr:hypothetical protein VHE8714_03045 [Vibrio splendidus]